MTERSLQDFFDTLRSAQQANRSKFAGWYDVMERIDRCFVRAGKNLIEIQSPMTGAFLLRCQYAFKTAAGMALAGQVVEAFVMQRSALCIGVRGLRPRDLQDPVIGRRVLGPPHQRKGDEDAEGSLHNWGGQSSR